MPADSFSRALDDLDPISRALVELSVRQGLDDDDIAGMLGREPAEVTDEREAALRVLAREIAPHAKSAPLAELETAIAAAIGIGTAPEAAETGDAARAANGAAAPGAFEDDPEDREATRPHLHVVQEPEPPQEQPSWLVEPRYEPPPRRSERRQSRLKTLLPVLVILLVVAVVVGLQRSGSGDESSDPSTPTPAPAAQADQPAGEPKDAKPETKPVALSPIAGAPDGVKGNASIADGRLKLNVTGLPEGAYGVWLFNSLIDSQELGTAEGTKISLSKKLPADAGDYQYVDVSVEPADGNPNHSGDSVIRIPLDKIEK